MNETYAEMAERLFRDAFRLQRDALNDSLFRPLEPPHNGTETSREAAAKIVGKVEIDRQRILDSLVAYGPQTRDELHRSTGIPENTINPRVFELVEKLGLAHIAGKRDGRSVVHFGPNPQERAA